MYKDVYIIIKSPSLCNFSDIDEYKGNHSCHWSATCTNTVGSHDCQCQPVYTGNGQSCTGSCSLSFQVRKFSPELEGKVLLQCRGSRWFVLHCFQSCQMKNEEKRNLQMSLWVEWGNVVHDSLHFIFFLMSKKKVENRSSHARRKLASFFINLRSLSEYG